MPVEERLVRQQRAHAADVESPDTHELRLHGTRHALNGGFRAISCARQIAAIGRLLSYAGGGQSPQAASYAVQKQTFTGSLSSSEVRRREVLRETRYSYSRGQQRPLHAHDSVNDPEDGVPPHGLS